MGQGEVRKGERESGTITKKPAAVVLAWVLDNFGCVDCFLFVYFFSFASRSLLMSFSSGCISAGSIRLNSNCSRHIETVHAR